MFASRHSSPTAPTARITRQSAQMASNPLKETTSRANKKKGAAPTTVGGKRGTGKEPATSGRSPPAPEGVLESANEEEPTEEPTCMIRNAVDAKAFLQEESIIGADEELDMDVMLGALIHISADQDVPLAARQAVRSVALILNQLKMDAVGHTLISMIEQRIDTLVEKVIERVMGTLKTAVDLMVAELKAASMTMSTSATQFSATTTSYRDALHDTPANTMAGTATLDVQIRAREGIKTRQVLLDAWAPGQALLPGSANSDIVEVGNKVIAVTEGAAEHRFVSARWLNNGGILLELNSEAAATWLGDPATKALFLDSFAPDATVKTRTFPLVVQFVPLRFKPGSEVDLRQIEGDNSLPSGSVLRARWIKPEYRRAPDQTCGHAILTVSKPETANLILTSGLLVCQKRVYVEKCKKEPTRCLKCHGWGHMSYDCKQAFDTCRTCAGRHWTTACMGTQHIRCVSCNVEGHASWDRLCPTFIHKCDELNDRLSKNNMLYYPTNKPWTHATQPPKPQFCCPLMGPPMDRPPTGLSQMGYKQTMLCFPPSQCHPGPTVQLQGPSSPGRGDP